MKTKTYKLFTNWSDKEKKELLDSILKYLKQELQRKDIEIKIVTLD